MLRPRPIRRPLTAASFALALLVAQGSASVSLDATGSPFSAASPRATGLRSARREPIESFAKPSERGIGWYEPARARRGSIQGPPGIQPHAFETGLELVAAEALELRTEFHAGGLTWSPARPRGPPALS